MFKKIIIFILSILSLWVGLSLDNNYYEYAKITDTDIIEFNTQIAWISHKVYINTWEINYITWSKWDLNPCFPIVWTWYTEKLWKIYFQYNNRWSYICSDNKLRWVFKIWAWWWWYMEDLENTNEVWKNYIDKNNYNWSYYHSKDWNSNWTWQAWIEWIWFANWNNARTKFDIQNAFSNVNIQTIFNWWVIANWYNTWSLIINIVHKNGSLMKNVKIDNIEFITWYNSDIKKNWNTIPWYKYNWKLTTNNNWQIIWTVIPYIWGWKKYGLKIKIWEKEIIKEWSVQFKYPFNFKFTIKDNNIRNKKLIWEDNIWKIEENNVKVNNLVFSNINSLINLNWNENYFKIVNWQNIWLNNNWVINLKPNLSNWYYNKDNLELSYNVSWNYSYKLWTNTYYISWFKTSTNNERIYKDWLINNISISKATAKSHISNWKNILWYDLKFYDKHNYPINNINFNKQFKDTDKSFDIDDFKAWYQTWFFLTWDSSLSNTNWTYKIWIISYKPVYNAYLNWYINNIKYSWHYNFTNSNKNIIANSIHFSNPIWVYFEDKILNANENEDFNIKFDKWISNIKNSSYNFTWYIEWCWDCKLTDWKSIQSNNFQEKTHNIYISWSTAPSWVIYTWYYSYILEWVKWDKKIKMFFKKEYSPIIYINKWDVKIVWVAASNNKILWWVDYISTWIEPYIMKNEIKKHILSQTNGKEIKVLKNNINIKLYNLKEKQKIYKCDNNQMVNISWSYNNDKEIILLWCKINIEWNIIWNNGHLRIFSYNNKNEYDFNNINGWKNKSNIYIKDNVDTIQASLYTNWSIFTYKSDIDTWVFIWREQLWFKKQLYINWKVFSKNTIWWWEQDNDLKFTIVWWKKVSNSKTIFWKRAHIVAQAYDLNFWRTSILKSDDKTYNTWDISQIIYSKYNCTWNIDNDNSKLCSASLIIEEYNQK